MNDWHEMPNTLCSMSTFLKRYLQIVERVSHQIPGSTSVNILSFKDILLTRIENESAGQNWPNDELTVNIKRRWEGSKTHQGWYQLWWNASNMKGYTDEVKLDSEILKYLGIKGWQHPEEILFDEIEEYPEQRYIIYQDPRTFEYFRFYGTGRAQTRDEFIQELKQSYEGYDNFELEWVSDVIITPAVTAAVYRGNTIITNYK